MMSNGKVMNTKVSDLIKMYDLYLGYFVFLKNSNNI
jgi:hypothetical protein